MKSPWIILCILCLTVTYTRALCGNGVVESGEQCDDGNLNNGDGCSSNCTIENNWSCYNPVYLNLIGPTFCKRCGNGIIEVDNLNNSLSEQCDDGNTNNNDGCSNSCTIESGYTCKGQPSKCSKASALSTSGFKKEIIIIVVVGVCGIAILVITAVLMVTLYRRRRRVKRTEHQQERLKNIWTESVEMSVYVQRLEGIEVGEKIGESSQATVYKGVLQGTTNVALKRLKEEILMSQFTNRAHLLQMVVHPHIVKFLGVFNTPEGRKYIASEYMEKGNLQHFLQTKKEAISVVDMIGMARHTASGMKYILEDLTYTHNNLTLRNLLLTSFETAKIVVKISDLGLMKPPDKETKKNIKDLRWIAPEILQHGKVSDKSDVFSFGVVLWEIFSYGKQPYSGMSLDKIAEKVISGYRMPPPDNCPSQIYELMVRCQSTNPDMRPTFSEICDELDEILTQVQKDNNVTTIMSPVRDYKP